MFYLNIVIMHEANYRAAHMMAYKIRQHQSGTARRCGAGLYFTIPIVLEQPVAYAHSHASNVERKERTKASLGRRRIPQRKTIPNRYRWKIYISAMYDRDLNVKKQSKQIITFCVLKYNLKLTQTNITEGRLHYKT